MTNRDIESVLRRALGADAATTEAVPAWLLNDTLNALEMCDRQSSLAELEATDDLVLPANVRGAAVLADYSFRVERRDGTGLLIEIDVITDGESVLEGRISPPSAGAVELISRLLRVTQPLDEFGRFNFDVVPRGTVRFAVQLQDERIVTDWVVLRARAM
jgi:hypothetical protein